MRVYSKELLTALLLLIIIGVLTWIAEGPEVQQDIGEYLAYINR